MSFGRILAAIIWSLIGCALMWAYFEHGRMIGGTKYFAHMGLAGAQVAELALVGGAFLLALSLSLRAEFAVKPIAAAVTLIGCAFASSFVIPLPPFHLLAPYVFPFGRFGVFIPALAAFLGAVTFLAAAERDAPDLSIERQAS